MTEPAEEIQFLTQWRLVRSAIEHENTLKSHRVTWFLATQLFLFTGFTSIFVEAVKNNFSFWSLKVYAVLAIIFFMGIYVCILAWVSLLAAQKMITRLQNWWLIHCHNTSEDLERWILSAKYGLGQEGFPPVNGIFTSNIHRIFDEAYLPVALLLFWLILFLLATLMALQKRCEAKDFGCFVALFVMVALFLLLVICVWKFEWIKKRLSATSKSGSNEFIRVLKKRGIDISEEEREDIRRILDNHHL